MSSFFRSIPLALTVAVMLPIPGAVVAQEEDEEWRAIPWSQRGAVMQRVGYTDISITYNRPVARGRELFGNVVKWGRIWNPGADSATTITLSDDVVIEGHRVPAGSYTLWMIPKEAGPWTVIFSNRTDIFHTPYPGEEHDALRFEMTPTTGSHMEALAFYFPITEKNQAVLRFHWGETVIPFAIEAKLEP